MIVNGTEISQKILTTLSSTIQKSTINPHLGVVLVGNDPASQTYVKKKQQAAEYIGVRFTLFKYPSTIKTDELVEELIRIQTDRSLTGMIVQLPLPKGINKQQVLNALNPEIDVDYLTWVSLGKLVIGENPLIPPTPGAVLAILDYYQIPLKGQHVVLVGAGDLIGKPLTNILIHMPVTLTVCNKDTKNLAEITKQADILITGAGQAELIRGSMVKKGVVVIDAGVSFRGKKMFGDVKFDEVSIIASLITPTPGGVGPITVAKLLENTVINSGYRG